MTPHWQNDATFSRVWTSVCCLSVLYLTRLSVGQTSVSYQLENMWNDRQWYALGKLNIVRFQTYFFLIWTSWGNVYEDCYLLGCNGMLSGSYTSSLHDVIPQNEWPPNIYSLQDLVMLWLRKILCSKETILDRPQILLRSYITSSCYVAFLNLCETSRECAVYISAGVNMPTFSLIPIL